MFGCKANQHSGSHLSGNDSEWYLLHCLLLWIAEHQSHAGSFLNGRVTKAHKEQSYFAQHPRRGVGRLHSIKRKNVCKAFAKKKKIDENCKATIIGTIFSFSLYVLRYMPLFIVNAANKLSKLLI